MGFLKEFKEFAMRGNVMDMAIGVVIGGAFTSIVNSLVGDIITPLIGIITGGTDFSDLKIVLTEESSFGYGAFITAIINFIIIAFCMFLVVKAMNKLRDLRKKEPEAEAPPARTCPYCKQEIPDDATRCHHCTSKLEGYANSNEAQAAVINEQKAD